jgi:transcriptional regulator with XRE-family HTH domain
MDENYIKRRIAQLRTQQGISARELSLTLGQSTGYINTIENGKSLPSMSMFLVICDYFKISPKDFFDEEVKYPKILSELVNESKKLDEKSLQSLLTLIKNMKK